MDRLHRPGAALLLVAASACFLPAAPAPSDTRGSGGPPDTTAASTTGAPATTLEPVTTGAPDPTTSGSSSSSGSSGAAGTQTSDPPDDGERLVPKVTEVWAFEAMDLGDVDGDGRLDLVTSGTGQPPRVIVYPGRGDGTFDRDAAVVRELSAFSAFLVADVTGDGRADVLTQGTGYPPRLTVHAGQADLGVSELATTEVFVFTRMHASDLTGDGRADVLLGDGDANLPWVQVWRGGASGLDDAPIFEGHPWRYDILRGGDVDGDGRADLVTASAGTPPQLHVHAGDGGGGFGEPVSSPIFQFSRLDLGDLDGDGRLDVVTDIPNNPWRFQAYRAVPGGWDPAVAFDAHNFVALELGDLDGDGRADLVLEPTGEPPRVEVYLSPLLP